MINLNHQSPYFAGYAYKVSEEPSQTLQGFYTLKYMWCTPVGLIQAETQFPI